MGQVGSKRNTSQCLRTVAKNNKTQSKKTLLHRLLCLLKEQPPRSEMFVRAPNINTVPPETLPRIGYHSNRPQMSTCFN